MAAPKMRTPEDESGVADHQTKRNTSIIGSASGRRKSNAFDRDRLPSWHEYAARFGVTLTGRGKWVTAACPFHGGSDSLRVNTESGGWVCMSCFAKGGDVLSYHMQTTGRGFVEAAQDLGAWSGGTETARRYEPAKLSAADRLTVLRRDALLLWIVVNREPRGDLPEWDRADFNAAVRRILFVTEDSQP